MIRPATGTSTSYAPIFCAIDTPDLGTAKRLVAGLKGVVGGVKLGLEFFAANGPDGVRAVAHQGVPVFLDLKFHDIPNTVAGAVAAATTLDAAVMTVHAAGGRAMMEAAAMAASKIADATGRQRPRIVAVTILTSLAAGDLNEMGIAGSPADQVRRLSALAKSAGLDGVVCSAHEAAMVREECGPGFLLVVPGVRPAGSVQDDQKRVTTPAEAIRLGADILVIGRPITAAPDPAEAARRIAAGIAGKMD